MAHRYTAPTSPNIHFQLRNWAVVPFVGVRRPEQYITDTFNRTKVSKHFMSLRKEHTLIKKVNLDII